MPQSISEDVTQPGLPRAYYNAHGRVGDLVVEAQRAVSQVTFSGNPAGHVSASVPILQPQAPTSQEAPVQSPFLPTPSLGSELTLGAVAYGPPAGPPPVCCLAVAWRLVYFITAVTQHMLRNTHADMHDVIEKACFCRRTWGTRAIGAYSAAVFVSTLK